MEENTLAVVRAEKVRTDKYHGSVVMHLWRVTSIGKGGKPTTSEYWTYGDYTSLAGKTVVVRNMFGDATFEVVGGVPV